MLTIKAAAPQGARCTATISLTGRPIARLASRELASGRTIWTHRLSATAKLGNYRVVVSCSKGGRASAAFKVGAPPIAPAQISVVKSGFSTEPIGGQTFLNCGVQLQNTSTSDARNVAVTVTFADTQERSLATDEIDLTVIPAGQSVYASCATMMTSVTLSVASVQVAVKVGESAAKGSELPAVSGLTLTPDEFGTQTLTGNLTNPYATPLPDSAVIYAVYYDASGDIVGGDQATTGASVEPGATIAFSFPNVATNVASAQVSVDPCGFAAELGTCQVPS